MRHNETVKLDIFLLSYSEETLANLYNNSLIGVLLLLEKEITHFIQNNIPDTIWRITESSRINT